MMIEPQFIPRTMADLHYLGGLWRHHPRYDQIAGHWMFLEGGGTALFDVSGRGPDGILTNMASPPLWEHTVERPGVRFDGSNDFIHMGNTLYTPDYRTYSCWIKTAAAYTAGEAHCALISKWGGGQAHAIFWLTGGDVRWGDTSSSRLSWTGGVASIEDNQWHHLCAVRNGTNGYIYFDGVEKASGSGFVDNSSSEYFALGAYGVSTSPNGRYQGLYGDARCYSRALSAAEVLSLYTDPWLEFHWAERVLRDAIAGEEVAGGPPPATAALRRLLLQVGL